MIDESCRAHAAAARNAKFSDDVVRLSPPATASAEPLRIRIARDVDRNNNVLAKAR
jgi:hypothetical protein